MYFILGCAFGMGTIVLAFWITALISKIVEESSPIKKEESPPQEPMQAAQFVDPEPLSDKLKDGTELKEIIE